VRKRNGHLVSHDRLIWTMRVGLRKGHRRKVSRSSILTEWMVSPLRLVGGLTILGWSIQKVLQLEVGYPDFLGIAEISSGGSGKVG
jgi:hypothetical protein